VALDWSRTTVAPLAGESWAVLFADDLATAWAQLPPGRLSMTNVTDATAASVPLRLYRATVLSPNGCPADDPFRR
jgi:hypothetical protein